MIKLEELRIGNWLKEYAIENKFITNNLKILFTFQVLQADFILPAIRLARSEPILITESKLKRLGFKESTANAGRMPCFKKGDFIIADFDENGWQVWIGTKELVKIKYIHQLQNIYFAITGEELKTIEK